MEAVRDGHRVARAIQHFLDTGESIKQPVEELVSLGEIPWKTIERIQKRSPILPELLPAESRVMSFSAVEAGFTEADALAEASRCMACATGAFVDEDKCAGCLTCVRVCPYGVATVDRTAAMPQEECQTCGLCAAACPAAAIALKRFETDTTRDRVSEIIAEVKDDAQLRPLVVAYCCQFTAASREFLQVPPDEASTTGVVRVMVPCVGRLNDLDLLTPFELGADGVAVVACAEESCLYPTAEERLEGHVKRVREILDEIDVGGEKLHYLKTEITVEAPWSVLWEKIKGELQGMEVEA